MRDTNFKTQLLAKALLSEVKKLSGASTISLLAQKLGVNEDQVREALSLLEEKGYVKVKEEVVEETWTSKLLEENWRPRGVKAKLKVAIEGGEAKIMVDEEGDVEAVVIKGFEQLKEKEKPSTIETSLKTLLKAKRVAEKASTRKALHYAQHLTRQALEKLKQDEKLSKEQNEKIDKIIRTLKPDKRAILSAITEIEKLLRGTP